LDRSKRQDYSDHLVWPFGVDEWPHWVRMMDRLDPSYRT
jgi:hypothetical protein